MGGDAVDLAEGHAQVLGHRGEGLGRDPALRMLDGMERGQEPGALSRELVEGDHGSAAGSWSRASAKPLARSRHESQAPHGRPSRPGS